MDHLPHIFFSFQDFFGPFFFQIGLTFTQVVFLKWPQFSDPFLTTGAFGKGMCWSQKSGSPWETSGDGSLGRRNLDLLWFERGAKMMILGHMLVANGAAWLSFPLQDCWIFGMPKNWNWWPEVWCRIGGLCSHFMFKRERSVCDPAQQSKRQ